MKKLLSFLPFLILGIVLLIFPFLIIVIVPAAIITCIIYGLFADFRNKGKLFKISLSMLLVLIFSHIFYLLNGPCPGRIFCDYAYGFPVPFMLVSDYISLPIVLTGLIGFAMDTALWYAILTLVFRKVFKK